VRARIRLFRDTGRTLGWGDVRRRNGRTPGLLPSAPPPSTPMPPDFTWPSSLSAWRRNNTGIPPFQFPLTARRVRLCADWQLFPISICRSAGPCLNAGWASVCPAIEPRRPNRRQNRRNCCRFNRRQHRSRHPCLLTESGHCQDFVRWRCVFAPCTCRSRGRIRGHQLAPAWSDRSPGPISRQAPSLLARACIASCDPETGRRCVR
jgi:hypothetical protein